MSSSPTLSGALEREHREIDSGIEAFAQGLASGEADPEPLLRAMEALRRHIYLEEEFVFPPLRAAGMVPPILVMLREHGELWDAMDSLDALLNRSPGEGVVLGECQGLLAKLASHNSKEEPIIYPQADAVMADGADADLRAFMDGGRVPAGWVCQQAKH